ncbi:MAG: DUF1080 domain-containing protein [Planctomycetes bacterium]|nr:DUF1080 domain-containing protein [Planctomycetota bacterium]
MRVARARLRRAPRREEAGRRGRQAPERRGNRARLQLDRRAGGAARAVRERAQGLPHAARLRAEAGGVLRRRGGEGRAGGESRRALSASRISGVLALTLAILQQAPSDLSADFEVPEGLAVTLWAETPQLYNPTAMDVDAQGRVWVTEAVNYRRWDGRNPGFTRAGGDRVVILEDTDGDGRCDSSRVFAQDAELVAPLGICVLGERVLVSCSPSILEFQDRNGDGDALDAGEKSVFLTGFGGHDHDHGVHSLVPGYDGRLYFTTGNAGPHIVTDKSGWTLRSGSVYRDGGAEVADNKPGLVSDDGRVYTGGMMLSVNPDGTKLRVEAHNFRNPYELALDPAGNIYTFDNDDEVVTCRVSWVLPGGNYGFFSADGSRTWRADARPGQATFVAQWHQDDPGVVTSGTLTGGGGPTGVLVYEHKELRPWFGGQFLAADAGRGTVFAFQPRAAGAGIELEPRPALIASSAKRETESARWFRPSDVCVGVDGSLFVADWYDPGVGGHAMGDPKCNGRILRIALGERPRGGQGQWIQTENKRWLDLLQPDKVVPTTVPADPRLARLRAARSLPLAGNEAEFAYLAAGYDGADRVYLEAFGLACEGKEDVVYALLEKGLGEPLQWDARFAGLAWRLHSHLAVPAFAARAMDASLAQDARKQALDALAFSTTKDAADAMANLAVASPEDLRPYARWWLENRATNDWAGWVDARGFGGTLADAELAWSSGVVRTGLHEVDVDVSGATKLWLVVTEGAHGNSYDWADWLTPRFIGAHRDTKLLELDWLEERAGWGGTYEGKSAEGGALVVEKKTYTDGLGTHARSEIAYAIPKDAQRFQAIAAPDDMGSNRAGSTNELEFQVWLERPPTRARVEQLVAAAFGLRHGADERASALRELALDPEGGLLLIQKAERTELTSEQRAAVAERIFQNPDLGVRARASAVFQRAGDRPRPALASLLALKGDATRGRELFLDPRAQCATCHAFELGGRRRGGDVGPELTGVRAKFAAAQVFDAILNPSAEIAHGFETWRIETQEGELVSGFLLADGATVILKDTQGKRHALAARDIAERTPETLSVMPDGVAAGLSDQELADLVAFLRDDPTRAPEFGPEVALFDGKSFAGWTYLLDAPGATFADVWSIHDGAIVCKGNPVGYLRTEAEFTNFELTLEWRFDPALGPGNSGVLLRRVGADKVWPKSIEAQLQYQNAGDIWNIDEVPMAVDEERTDGRHTARRAPCAEKPLGEWNRYRIRLDHGALTLEVNGVVQNTASWCQEVAGNICLQSEGAAIEFREVKLRPILN